MPTSKDDTSIQIDGLAVRPMTLDVLWLVQMVITLTAQQLPLINREVSPTGCKTWSNVVETRGIEPLTPALQRQCSAN